jgi:glycopeptide antibiotics resistance protein
MYKNSTAHEIWLVIFAGYIAGLLSLTVFPTIIFSGSWPRFIIIEDKRTNFIPFYEFFVQIIQKKSFNYFLINILGNIGVFVPIGFFPPLLWRKVNWRTALLIGSLFSAFIETVQYFTGRACDINDILLNVLGCMLGYWLYRLFLAVAGGYRADKFRQSKR